MLSKSHFETHITFFLWNTYRDVKKNVQVDLSNKKWIVSEF